MCVYTWYYLKEERESIVSQFTQQFPLGLGVHPLLSVLQGWIDLPGGHVDLSTEGYPHHIRIVLPVTEYAGQGDKSYGDAKDMFSPCQTAHTRLCDTL